MSDLADRVMTSEHLGTIWVIAEDYRELEAERDDLKTKLAKADPAAIWQEAMEKAAKWLFDRGAIHEEYGHLSDAAFACSYAMALSNIPNPYEASK